MPHPVPPATTDADLLDAAEQLLRSAGPHALSLRRIADLAGTSTQAVYTRFGGKPALIDALFRTGFDRLAARLDHIGSATDPIALIVELSLAYRDNALANPHLYDIMTGHPLPGCPPSAESLAVARSTMRPLVEAVESAVDVGELVGDPHEIAHALWAAAHGFVSLLIHGFDTGGDADVRYRSMTRHVLDGYRPNPRER